MKMFVLVSLSLAACADGASGHIDLTITQPSATANVDPTPFSGEVAHNASWSDQAKVAFEQGTRRIILVIPKPVREGETFSMIDTLAGVVVMENFAACDSGGASCRSWMSERGTMTVERFKGGELEVSVRGDLEGFRDSAVGTFSIEGRATIADAL
jgi:hypothetical protein